MKDLALVFLLFVKIVFEYLTTPSNKHSRRRIIKIIKRKYPSYRISELKLKYADWSSTIREADGDIHDHKATCAEAVIKNEEEQRRLHFQVSFRIWKITHDTPDFGKNVPDGEYFMEKNCACVGKRIDIEQCVSRAWVIPEENGRLYHKVGSGDNWYYMYHYIKELYRTGDGRVYILNKDTFEWEPSDILYSQLDYYCNYTPISKETAEKMIDERRQRTDNTR